MACRLFTVLSALSLLLCGVVLFACLCSYCAFAPIGQYWQETWAVGEARGWLAKDGSLHVVSSRRTVEPLSPTTYRGEDRRRSGIDPAPGLQLERTRFGFANFRHVSGWGQWAGATFQRVTDTRTQLSFPLWLLALVLALPTAGRLVANARQRNRRTRGLCAACGYDLRASPGRCPECGAGAGSPANAG
jgi:hypothetical protein